jgi:hypothetical protein
VANERSPIIDYEKLKSALEELDKLPVFNHSKQKLEAHLVAVEEDGKVIGEVVELRTKQGATMLVMCPSDYYDLVEWEQKNDN